MGYPSPMNDLQTLMQRYSRRFLAVGILIISLLAAVALAGQADSSVSMWSAKYSLSSGEKVKESDLEVVKVSLKKQAPQYFSSKALLVGSYFTKAIGQGELIPVSAVTKLAPGTFSKEVPVGIAKSDLPSGSKVGDLVDLYSIPSNDPNSKSSLVISRVTISAIDLNSQNMGGSINVLFRIDSKAVLSITDAIASGRIVVIKNAF